MKPDQKNTPNPYQFSPRFIKLWTTICLVIMGLGFVAGFIVGSMGDASGLTTDQRNAQEALGIAIMIGSFFFGILIAAVLGAESIKRGTGIIGFFFTAGFASLVFGSLNSSTIGVAVDPWRPLLFWGGIGLLVLAGLSYFVIGWIAKVPIWLQLPIFKSPRLYIRGSSKKPMDVTLPNKLDGKKRTK